VPTIFGVYIEKLTTGKTLIVLGTGIAILVCYSITLIEKIEACKKLTYLKYMLVRFLLEYDRVLKPKKN